jgi:capsular polysaccharide biosynthesis protein
MEYSEFAHSLRPRPSSKKQPGKWTTLSSRPYAHWLLEDVPRFIELLSLEEEIGLLVSPSAAKYTYDFLEILNLKPNLVSEVARVEFGTFISAPSVGEIPSKSDIEILRGFSKTQVIQSEIISQPKYIYISRRRNSRSLNNERDLEIKLSNLGFSILYLQELSLHKQILVFKSAKIIVGPHGAGLANMVWCENDPLVIEIFKESLTNRAFLYLSKLLPVRFHQLAEQNLDELFFLIAISQE